MIAVRVVKKPLHIKLRWKRFTTSTQNTITVLLNKIDLEDCQYWYMHATTDVNAYVSLENCLTMHMEILITFNLARYYTHAVFVLLLL